MSLSVLIPSFRRPIDLERCLGSLVAQVRVPGQVVVVARVGDWETSGVARGWGSRLAVDVVEVEVPGVVQAMNAGLARCTGDIVAITDDDAAPRPDWLGRIEAHFAADPLVGGVGGRDWVHQDGRVQDVGKIVVGKVCWFGRMVGNHHLGIGPARGVDVLKGVNCAFRMVAIGSVGFDTRLRGAGAQVHWEMCLCFAVKRAGWRLIFDPAVAVDHYPAVRVAGDDRVKPDYDGVYNASFNFAMAVRRGLGPGRRHTAIIWYLVIGEPKAPGFLRMVLLVFRGEFGAATRWWTSWAGAFAGWREAARKGAYAAGKAVRG